MADVKREVWVLEAVVTTLFQVPEGTPLAASPDREQLLRLGDNIHRYVPAEAAGRQGAEWTDPYAAIRADFAIAWDNTHPDSVAGRAISRISHIITIPSDFTSPPSKPGAR